MDAEPPLPPVAPRRPTKLVAHGDERVDEWYWLRDKDDPEVMAHLTAENDHTREALARTAAAQELIFEEMRERILETDVSVPAAKGEWSYYSRTVEGLQYPISCRRRVADDPEGEEQVLLDQNELAGDSDYFAVVNHSLSPDASLLAYATDDDGSERYTLHVRDLATGHDLADEVPGTYYGLAWAADNRTVFYTKVDEATRPHQLWRHVVGTPAADDVLVFQEDDDHFFLGVHETLSERYILLGLESKVTSEVHYLATDDPNGKFQVVQPREQGVEYEVDHHAGAGRDRFFIVTNAGGAENFKLVEAPVATPGNNHWTEVVPHRPDVRLDGIEVFAEHVVLFEKTGGLRRIAIRRISDGDTHVIEQPEPVYTVYPETNLEFDTRTFRYGYSSLVMPASVYDYDLDGRSRRLLKRQPVLGGYEPEEYETRRLWAVAPDGVKVPMSVVHRRGLVLDGSAPTLLYGYGSYESSVDPSFSAFRLSLLERGFVYAIAHVRGGGEMGRQWYEAGKILNKKNTFSDFVACAQHLVAEGYTAPDRLAIRGGSAGGLLMGAVTNMAPELFKAVVAVVPFVDVLTTILDESLPLTVMEWEEWGNPEADPEIYRYIKSYSPYDNVAALPYPAILVLGGLNDPRVSYWEPAKWVQRLRERSTSANPVLLKTEMGGGHMGPSGRYDAWREEALMTTFVLDALGIPLPESAFSGP